MDFSIPEPHRQFAATFERFCQERIAPRAASVDKAGHLPPETWADLAEIGFFGLYHEPEWGGAPGDWLMRALAEEALAKACASTFLSAGASVGLCGGPIARFGSRAQIGRAHV